MEEIKNIQKMFECSFLCECSVHKVLYVPVKFLLLYGCQNKQEILKIQNQGLYYFFMLRKETLFYISVYR